MKILEDLLYLIQDNNYSDQDSVILAQRQIGQWDRIESRNRSTYKLSSSF